MRLTDMYRVGRALVDRCTEPTLARIPLSPLALTVGGTVLHIAVAALLAWGHLRWAAGIMLLAGMFDIADGSQARVTGRQSKLGAFLDATLDRYSEALAGLGLLIYLLQQGTWLDLLLVYLFVSGSLIFSYTRARAEAEGLVADAGLFTRLVRVVLLAIGLLAGQVRITLWVLVIGVIVSAIHRLVRTCLGAQSKVSLEVPSEVPPEALPPLRRWLSRLGSRTP